MIMVSVMRYRHRALRSLLVRGRRRWDGRRAQPLGVGFEAVERGGEEVQDWLAARGRADEMRRG